MNDALQVAQFYYYYYHTGISAAIYGFSSVN